MPLPIPMVRIRHPTPKANLLAFPGPTARSQDGAVGAVAAGSDPHAFLRVVPAFAVQLAELVRVRATA